MKFRLQDTIHAANAFLKIVIATSEVLRPAALPLQRPLNLTPESSPPILTLTRKASGRDRVATPCVTAVLRIPPQPKPRCFAHVNLFTEPVSQVP